MQPRVLIIEDEQDVLDLVRYHLQKAGFEVLTARDGTTGLCLAVEHRPEILVLDLMLPGLDGNEICRTLKGNPDTARTGIIMLTAKGTTRDRVKGLEQGADDYVTKPFSPKELVLRVQAVARRLQSGGAPQVVDVDDFVLDKAHLCIKLKGQKLDLTPTEYKMMSLLIEHRGRTLSRDFLLQEVWGYPTSVDTRTVDTHMRRVREKLGEYATRIETVRGEGYRFSALPVPTSGTTLAAS